jgi:hypothetical protein
MRYIGYICHMSHMPDMFYMLYMFYVHLLCRDELRQRELTARLRGRILSAGEGEGIRGRGDRFLPRSLPCGQGG